MARESVSDLARLLAKIDRLERAIATPQLPHSSLDDAYFVEKDANGTVVSVIGKQHDGTHGVGVVNGPVPPTPSAPIVDGGPVSLTVFWDGKYTDADVRAPMDFAVVEVYASSQPFSDISEAALVGPIADDAGGSLTFSRPVGTWYVALVTKSVPGRRSPISQVVTGEATEFVSDEAEQQLQELRDELDQVNIDLGNALDRIVTVEDGVTTAIDSANGAAETAEGRPKIFFSLNEPGTTEAPQGSIWWQRNANNDIIGQWQQTAASNTGSTWQKEEIASEVIANLDVGKLTVGDATIDSAVIEELWTKVVRSRRISTDMLLVGSGANHLPDPRFEDQVLTDARAVRSSAQFSNGAFTTTGFLYMCPSASIADGRAFAIPAIPGEQYRFTFPVSGGAGTPEVPVGMREEFLATSSGRTGSVQQFVVPATGTYRITAYGAQGGSPNEDGGLGAKMSGDFQLTAGETIRILVGQKGGSSTDSGAGGGGTFVYRNATDTYPLLAAGGGGGAADASGGGKPGLTGTAGGHGQDSTTYGGGVDGNGSSSTYGGAGWLTDGGRGSAPRNGGYGGTAAGVTGSGADGGYGGGGGISETRGAGGGGYSGGGYGYASTPYGGGGGSYNGGTNQDNEEGVRAGSGLVVIEREASSGSSTMGRVERWRADGTRTLETVPSSKQSYNGSILSYTYEVPPDTTYISPVLYQSGSSYTVSAGAAAYRMTDASLIVDGGIIGRHITATDMFEGKEFYGGTFTGTVHQTGYNAPRLIMDPTGLSVWHLDPSGSGEQEAGRFGSDEGDFFSVPGATIDEKGHGSFTGISSADDLNVLGRPLIGDFEGFELPNEGNANGWLDRFPRGVVAFGFTSAAGRGIHGGEEALAELAFEAVPGRMYRITTRPIIVKTMTSGYGAMRLRNGGSSAPTLSSTTLMISRWRDTSNSNTRYYAMNVDWVGRCNIGGGGDGKGELIAGLNRIMVTLEDASVDSGAGYDQSTLYIMVEDLGIDTPSTAVLRTDTSVTTPPPPPTNPVKTYQRTWTATWMQSYAYNGSSRYAGTASARTQPTQGYTPYWSAGGIHTSQIGFDDAQIRSYLSGATIKKIELYVRADHFHYASGGILRIHRHGNSSSPSSYPTSSEPLIKNESFNRGQAKWVTLPNSVGDYFKSGTARGIGFDSRGSTSSSYYGNIYWSSYRPKLRITYDK